MDALNINAGIYFDDSTENSHDFNLGVAYGKDGTRAGIQYVNVGDSGVIPNSVASTAAIRLYGQYTMEQITIAGSLESLEPEVADTQHYLYLTASKSHFFITDNSKGNNLLARGKNRANNVCLQGVQ